MAGGGYGLGVCSTESGKMSAGRGRLLGVLPGLGAARGGLGCGVLRLWWWWWEGVQGWGHMYVRALLGVSAKRDCECP